MGGRNPGPYCSSELGGGWCDKGTMIRSRSSASGPLGMLMSMIMAAAPNPGEEAEDIDPERLAWRKNREAEKQKEKADLERDTPIHVKKCIENLRRLPGRAWRSVSERDLILKKLEEMNSAGRIRWVDENEIGDSRGTHDREGIYIKIDFHSGDWENDAWRKSAPVLVHEGTHEVWTSSHFNGWRKKWEMDHAKSFKEHPKGEALIAEETYAWGSELLVYEVLKESGFEDIELEVRQRRKAAGSLEALVRDAYDGWINMDIKK